MFWYLLGILAAGLFYIKLIKPHKYWKERGVKSTKPVFLFGDTWKTMLLKESYPGLVQRVYTACPNERFSGVYQMLNPGLIIRDPELIKQLTVKDFDHFVDHIQLVPNNCDVLWCRNLHQLTGDSWREMRATMSPTFTSSKMKAMFVLMSECAEQFTAHFARKQEETQEIELIDAFRRYTTDAIATCVFGIKCDSLEERDNEFFLKSKEVTDFNLWKMIKITTIFTFPKVAKWFGLKFFSEQTSTFYINLVKQIVETRDKESIIRPDMINLLMEARKGGLVYEEHQNTRETGFATVEESNIGRTMKTGKLKITIEDITAQAVLFFFAGFDSVSNLMGYMGYELGVNPDIQEKLHQEIDDTLKECNGKVTYDALNKMKYLDMIIAETLRKWPPSVVSDRICTVPYTIKSQRLDEPSLTIKKGEGISIPIWGLHHDPQYYPEPDRFDPERFSEENKHTINPYAYLPFGTGPRNCIGSRFALLITKVVYFHLLAKFEIVVIKRTQISFKIKTSMGITPEGGFWFGLKRRNNLSVNY